MLNGPFESESFCYFFMRAIEVLFPLWMVTTADWLVTQQREARGKKRARFESGMFCSTYAMNERVQSDERENLFHVSSQRALDKRRERQREKTKWQCLFIQTANFRHVQQEKPIDAHTHKKWAGLLIEWIKCRHRSVEWVLKWTLPQRIFLPFLLAK